MAAKNIYANSLVRVTTTIVQGDSTSDFIDCRVMPEGENVGGASQLLAVILPSSFPAGDITFEDKQTEDDDPAQVLITDGADSGILTIPVPGGDRTKVVLAPYWLVSSGLISLVSENPMVQDTDVEFIFQPIIQSNA